MVDGTTNGVLTDLDGAYILTNVPSDATLVFQSIGYETQSILVSGRSVIDLVLKEDALLLEDVVVIGYGVQKKSVVSAAISIVGTEMLDKVGAVRVDDALKGLTPGVTVMSTSGQPGAGSQIRIRGIGTINDSNPLYVVDGMPMTSGIDYLAPQDIERIDILKDAASCAVYGTRGANGVIIVTTKHGATDKVSVNYDFQYGVQNPWRRREVLNATEYAVLMNEAALNAGQRPAYSDPYSYGKGTDWQEEIFNKNAPTQSHQISINGTSGKNQYYVSASYYSQEGIIGGNYDRSNYDRFTVRVNDRYNLFDATKERSWLNKMNLNLNVSYSRTKTSGIETNSEFGSPLGSAITLSPILGVYVDPADEASVIAQYTTNPAFGLLDSEGNLVNKYEQNYNLIRAKDGRLFTVPGSSYNEMVNPLADLSLPGDKNYYDRFVAGGDVELQLFDGLVFKSSISADLSFGVTNGWTPNYYLNANRKQGYSTVHSSMNRGFVWQLENTLTYNKLFDDKHNLTVMLGQSAMASTGQALSGSNMYLIEEDPTKANLGFALGTREDQGSGGYLYADYRLASLFARASYDYDGRYMVQATIRRDGSSRFGINNKFAIFPSASVAWNIKNEPFLKDKAQWLNSMKLRASWGINGNDRIGDFMYTALTASGNNYIFGSGAQGNETIVNGVKTTITPNPDLGWEQSNQTDLGLDFAFLQNSVLFSVDYFYKHTKGMLIEMPVPSYIGESKPWGNVGTMSNSGIELDLSYRYSIGDFNFSIGGNATWIKTMLINAGNETGILNRASFSTAGTIIRGENGMPFPYFYGYKTDGIFQNMSEVRAHSVDGTLIQPEALPGDVRFADLNGNGKIDEGDRTILGKCAPDWTYGLNMSVDWKGIDFSMMWQGVAGNSVFDGTRRTDISSANQPKWMLNRWSGEGTSNYLPRFTLSDTNNNWRMSDLYVKDASYLRLKNITLGYTLPVKWTNKAFVKKFRVYLAAENLLTLTKYDGFDPEISDYVDRGIYPQARTMRLGANIAF